MNLDIVRLSYLLLGISIFSRCSPTPSTNLNQVSLLPVPVEVTASGGTFQFSEKTKIFINSDLLQSELVTLNRSVLESYNYELKETNENSGSQIIALELDTANQEISFEGYELDIEEERIVIRGSSLAGVFYGIQTLDQLMYESSADQKIPTGKIVDYPKYEYRGMMLDVSRRFFTVEEVKRLIDQIAVLKTNVLHLHLSDDQGWRIEIKSRPKLTELGSKSEVGEGKGGFYTQLQYQDLVSYAASKYIVVIPEIDMPGHTNAALASYAELNCDQKTPDLYRGTAVGFSTFCTDSEATYAFIDDVIKELATLTPGKYIHIGGDESLVTEKEDYIYFVNRVQTIVEKHGKIMIGWDEIATADLNQSSVVQQWHSMENAKLAAQKGNQVILSPATHTYLDMKYDSSTQVGQDWAGLIPIRFGYEWLPDTLNDGITKALALGIEAPLWTEFVEDTKDMDYLIFPRFAGYAEIAWSPSSHLEWADYKSRLQVYAKRWDKTGVNYFKDSTVFDVNK